MSRFSGYSIGAFSIIDGGLCELELILQPNASASLVISKGILAFSSFACL